MKIPKARPIEDVMADLEPKLIRMLPGGQAVAGSWSAFCRARELLVMAELAIEKDRRGDLSEVQDYYVWIKHGERYAAMRIIHGLADAFRVENVTWREVPDAEGQPGEAGGQAGEVQAGGQGATGPAGDVGAHLPPA